MFFFKFSIVFVRRSVTINYDILRYFTVLIVNLELPYKINLCDCSKFHINQKMSVKYCVQNSI